MASFRPLIDAYGLPIGRRPAPRPSGKSPASPRLPWQLELIGLPLVLLLLIPLAALLMRTPVAMLYEYASDAPAFGASAGTQYATMLSFVSSGVGICTSSTRPGPQADVGSTHRLGRRS